MGFVLLFLALVAGHCIADYPLQGDFLAKAKNVSAPIPGVSWQLALWSHAIIHGGVVWLITGMWWLGVAEAVLHAAIDHEKCRGRVTFVGDQVLHLVCKALWVIAAALWVAA